MTKQEKIQILKELANYKPDVYKALDKLDCKTGIEIGVRKGGNLKNLVKNPKFKEGKLYGLDCWHEAPERPEINDVGFSQFQLDQQYLQVINMFANQEHVEIVRDFSEEGSQKFEDGYFDFIYIDAAHDYDSVKKDVEIWWPKLKEGGIFSGHDYFPDTRIWRGKKCGVWEAVNEFAEKMGTEVHHMTDTEKEGGPGVACNSFFIVK